MSASRSEGCTLTGALSVTTGVKDAVTIIHGPAGCAHHMSPLLSLLHEQDISAIPAIRCTDLRERVIFGGEEVLEALVQGLLAKAGSRSLSSPPVSSTPSATMLQVCSREYGVPVCYIPTQGFLGGVFQTGYENALCTFVFACRASGGTITLIGEKTWNTKLKRILRISRLLSSLGTGIGLRCEKYRDGPARRTRMVPSTSFVTDPLELLEKSSRRCLDGTSKRFPEGFSQTCDFLEKAGNCSEKPKTCRCGDQSPETYHSRFRDLAGQHVCFWSIQELQEIHLPWKRLSRSLISHAMRMGSAWRSPIVPGQVLQQDVPAAPPVEENCPCPSNDCMNPLWPVR